ncbi:MAG: endonuclease/exonuclease/phosphatase family protein [Saprospiraceae bacterium]
MLSRFKNIFKWLNLLLIIATLLSIFAPYASPRYGWWVSVFGMAFPWLFILNLLFVGFWLINKNVYFLFSTVCMLISWNALTGIIGFNGKDSASDDSIQVMTFNCRAFYDFTADEPTKDDILQVLRDELPDVICFQEFPMNPKSRAAIITAIEDQTNLTNFYQPDNYALAIFSKYPLKNASALETDNASNGCIYADVILPKGPMRIYNVHLKSNRVSDDANKVLAEPDLKKKSTWLGIKTMMGKIKIASKIRAQQAQRISDHVSRSKRPTVLCGDLNETPQSYAYRLLTMRLQDSFRQKGRGIGSTYAGKIPGLRIDYIFTGNGIRVSDYRRIKEDVSDHYPIVTTLDLK